MNTRDQGALPRRIAPRRGLHLWLQGARSVAEREWLASRRATVLFLSGSVEPMLYLAAFGIGVPVLAVQGEQGATYAEFIAPALLVMSTITSALHDSTYPMLNHLKRTRIYHAMLLTSLHTSAMVAGIIFWLTLRSSVYALIYVIVCACSGLIAPAPALAMTAFAVLISLVFAVAGLAATSFVRENQDLDVVHTCVLPLMLLSGTFYPIDVYPAEVSAVAAWSPVYHCVHVMRDLGSGVLGWGALIVSGYLIGIAAFGYRIACKQLEKRIFGAGS